MSDYINMVYDFFQGDFSITCSEGQEELAKKLRDVYAPRKKDTIKVSKYYRNMGIILEDERAIKKANKMEACGNFIAFQRLGEKRKLVYINSCKARFCPMCAWRKSLKIFSETIQVIEFLEKKQPSSRFLFLTLTQRNVSTWELKDEINKIIKALRNLLRMKEVKKVVHGVMRNIEITYNAKTDTWHPHVHMLLHVSTTYWNSNYYIHQPRWVYLWRKAMELDYDPNVDIRPLKEKENHREIAEIAKYAVKPSAITELPRNIAILESALFHKRLLSFTGSFKEARKLLKLKDDLTDEDVFIADKEAVYELYQWHFGKGAYERTTRFTL